MSDDPEDRNGETRPVPHSDEQVLSGEIVTSRSRSTEAEVTLSSTLLTPSTGASETLTDSRLTLTFQRFSLPEDRGPELEGLADAVKRLADRRLLVISCQHWPFLAIATMQLLQRMPFAGITEDRRLLHSDPGGTQELDRIEVILNDAKIKNETADQDSLVIVHVHRTSDATRLIAQLSNDVFGLIPQRLRSARQYLVLCFDPRMELDSLDTGADGTVPQWQIDFLRPLLERRWSAESAAVQNQAKSPEELAARIEAQPQQWPPRRSREFYLRISAVLKTEQAGYLRLCGLVDKGDTIAHEAQPGDDPAELDEPGRSLLLIACLIQQADLSVYEELTGFCLKFSGWTTIVEDRKFDTPYDAWISSRTRHLEQAGLRVVLSDTGEQVIDFADPERRPRILARFHSMLETREKLNQLLLPALFLHDRPLPTYAFDSLIRHISLCASQNPRDYDAEWLVRLFAHSDRFLPAFPENPDLHKVILFLAVHSRGRRHFFGRLADLCMQFLERPRTAEIVNAFLVILTQRIDLPTARFVLQLIRRLRLGQGFDELRWLRLILEQAPPEARREARRQLLSRTRDIGGTWSAFRSIQPWMPASDSQHVPRKSEQAAMYLPTLLFQKRNSADPAISVSPWQEMKMFSQEDQQELLALLCQWFVHPCLEQCCDTVVSDEDAPPDEMPSHNSHRLRFLLDVWTECEASPQSGSARTFLSLVCKALPSPSLTELLNEVREQTTRIAPADAQPNQRNEQRRLRDSLRALGALLQQSLRDRRR